MNKYIIKIRIFLWTILFLTVVWLLYMAIVPSGRISYVYNFEKDSDFISRITPQERVEPVKFGTQKIIGDPVYFNLRTIRKFNKAVLNLKYKNSSSTPLIESGVLVDKTIWRYDLKPVENRIVDQLSFAWDAVREEELVLLQREKEFSSINDFLSSLTDRNRIALYNYDLRQEYILPDYEKSEKEIVIEYPLRGSWQFYTYIKDEDLDYNFSFLDLNENDDLDKIDLHLYYADKLIDSRHLEDDSVERKLEFKLANLPEGIYKIELRVNDDIVTKKIETKQSKLAFINKMRFFNEDNNNIKLYTDSHNLQAKTVYPDSLQVIKANTSELDINQTFKQFESKIISTSTVKKINLPKDGLTLSGDGVFSFSEDAVINPSFKKVNNNININKENIDFVLAEYDSPKSKDNWKIAQVEFDLTTSYREDDKYSFLLSIPGLKMDDKQGDFIELDEIKIDLIGKSLLEKIKEVFYD